MKPRAARVRKATTIMLPHVAGGETNGRRAVRVYDNPNLGGNLKRPANAPEERRKLPVQGCVSGGTNVNRQGGVEAYSPPSPT